MSYEAIMEKIRKYRIYSNRGARGATGTSFTGPHYNPADLCAAQTRAIDQLLEYLDPKCDSYLTALVEDAVRREGGVK